jgi:hypothetical protein
MEGAIKKKRICERGERIMAKAETLDTWNEVQAVEGEIFRFEEAGDKIVGELVEKEENVGENNSMLYHIMNGDGNIESIWGSTVIDSRFKKIEPHTMVKIVFNGWKQGESGRKYKDFTVYTK